jgi:hypothetical protein
MRFLIAIALAASPLFSSCSSGDSASNGESDLAKQFIGHWSTPSDDHLYFGKIDATIKSGSYILVHPDGKAFTHRYEIESEDSDDRTIKVNLLFASGDSRETTYALSADGTSMDSTTIITGIETQSRLTKVNDKTAP